MEARRVLGALAILLSMFVEGCGLSLRGGPAGAPPLNPGATAGTPLAGPVSAPLPAGPGLPPDPAKGSGAPPPGGTGTGTAAANIAALDATGALGRDGFANDGRLTFTQYGGPTDGTPDENTRAGIGNRGNRLRGSSLALSPNLIRQYGLKGGEEIWIRTGGRQVYLGTYDDTTGNNSRNNVIDVYDPTDSLGRDNFMRTIQAGNWELVAVPETLSA